MQMHALQWSVNSICRNANTNIVIWYDNDIGDNIIIMYILYYSSERTAFLIERNRYTRNMKKYNLLNKSLLLVPVL